MNGGSSRTRTTVVKVNRYFHFAVKSSGCCPTTCWNHYMMSWLCAFPPAPASGQEVMSQAQTEGCRWHFDRPREILSVCWWLERLEAVGVNETCPQRHKSFGFFPKHLFVESLFFICFCLCLCSSVSISSMSFFFTDM